MMTAVEMHQKPMVNEPTVVEDLETGDVFHHPPEEPMASTPMASTPMASMDQTYQDDILSASKARRSKGVKRLLSLHHAIESKKAKGEWTGPPQPVAGMSQSRQKWLSNRVQHAIDSAPWRQPWK